MYKKLYHYGTKVLMDNYCNLLISKSNELVIIIYGIQTFPPATLLVQVFLIPHTVTISTTKLLYQMYKVVHCLPVTRVELCFEDRRGKAELIFTFSREYVPQANIPVS